MISPASPPPRGCRSPAAPASWLALALIATGCGAGAGDPGRVVDVATTAAIAEVAPEFLSFTLDTDLVVAQRYDLENPLLIARAAALAPAVLRVGGTKADGVLYDLSADPVVEPPAPYRWVLDAPTFDGLCELARRAGVKLLFDVNAGPGPRDADLSWNGDNATQLFAYAAQTGCPVDVWELGNEPGAWSLEHGIDVDGAQYARDFARFRALVHEHTPAARAAGPAVAYWPVVGEVVTPILQDFLAAGAGVDVVTWHYYPQQSSSCPVRTRPIADNGVLDVVGLDEIETWADQVEGWVAASAPSAEVWLGETGHAQCGGEPGVSDRFVTGLWWLDELGIMARHGERVVMRQALVGGAYTLLGRDDLSPRPDYINSALWKQLMGTRVLAATPAPGPASLRAYAHCTPEAAATPGAVTLLAINEDLGESAVVAPASDLGAARLVYRVSAPDLLSEQIFINGAQPAFDEHSRLVLPAAVSTRGAVTLPPASYAFIVLPDADAAACRP